MTYENARKAIEYMFSQSYWTSQGINLYPDNYEGTIAKHNEFLRINNKNQTAHSIIIIY